MIHWLYFVTQAESEMVASENTVTIPELSFVHYKFRFVIAYDQFTLNMLQILYLEKDKYLDL